MSNEKDVSAEVEKDSAEVAADTPVEDVAVEAEAAEAVSEEPVVEAEEVEAVEEEKPEDVEMSVRKELAAELTAMVAEFEVAFAVKCFSEGMSMNDAKLANYDNLKALASGRKADEADGVEALDLGVKPEEKTGDFESEWMELWRERNAAGESLSKSQAMEIVIGKNPERYFVGVKARSKKC